ncbi:MAG: ROK family protein, partial [Clostridia bacterium]
MNNTSDTNILAMDIGGTTIKSGSIDVATSLIKTFSVNKTHIHNGLSSIVESIDKAIARHLTSNTVGIAISSAGDIDAYSGKCVYATDNLPDFSGFDIKAYVESKYKLPCQVINDGQGALLGELNFGCAVNLTKVVMLTLGTGVGSAYFDKELGFDKSLELSKIGHYTLVKDGIQCNCGKRGCIEQYISAGALYKLGGARGLAITDCNDIFSLSRADNI